MTLRRWLPIVFLLAGLGHRPPAVSAGVVDEVARDFAPLAGVVVARRGPEYVIDLGSERGVSVGDLFAVTGATRDLVHPTTGALIGRLPATKAVLRVLRVAEDYAIARRDAPGEKVSRGDEVRRFEGMKAVFRDHTGDGERLYQRLRDALTALEWEGYRPARIGAATAGKADADLVFELRAGELRVLDGDFRLVASYAVTPAAPAPRAAPAPPRPAVGRGREDLPGLDRPLARVQRISGFRDRLSVGTFTVDGGRLLVATTDGDTVRVLDVDDGLATVASGGPRVEDTILSVHWWWPEAGGTPRLVGTAWDERRGAEGFILARRGAELVPVVERAPYILATFDRDADGFPELLLGQSFTRDGFFDSRVRALAFDGERLAESPPGFDPPPGFTVQGAILADVTGDGRLEVAFIRNRMLRVHAAGGRELYRSSTSAGGTISTVTYPLDPQADFSRMITVPFELPPVAVDLDGGGGLELVSISSERAGLGVPGIGPRIEKSWLAVYRFRDGAFTRSRLGPDHDVPIQGVAVVDDEVLFIAPQSHSAFRGARDSQLLALPLR